MCDFFSFTVPESASGRAGRLMSAYSNPLTEVYLLFFQSSLQVFVAFNKFLQREDSILPVLAVQMKSFLTKLFGRFVTVTAIRNADDIFALDYSEEHQLAGKLLACLY